jgi:hypothetical protein
VVRSNIQNKLCYNYSVIMIIFVAVNNLVVYEEYLTYVLLRSEVFPANNAVIDTSFNAPSGLELS